MIYFKNKFLTLVISISICSPLAAIAERMSLTRERSFPFEVINLPLIGIDSRTDVGQTMISAIATGKKSGIQVEEPLNFEVGLLFGSQKVFIDAIKVPYYGENENGTYFGGGSAAIFIPFSNEKSMMGCYLPASAIICDSFADIGITPKVKPIEIDFFPKLANKKELVYLGGNSKSISILYREFIGDYIKPAFTQEYKYDISEDRVIGFKGARFEVIKADNTEVIYRAIKHLENK